MKKILLLSCLIIALLMSCSKRDTETTQTESAGKTAVKQQTLLIGLIPEQNIFEQIKRYTPLAEYMSKKTGVEIKLKILIRYGNIVDNFKSMGLDGAFFGSFTYSLAHARLGVEVFARPESVDGLSSYHGLIFVRKDSGMSTVNEMKGKIFAFVDKATTAGYLYPLAYFRRHGIKDSGSFFKETYYAGTHEDVLYDVLNKRADIGAVKNTVFYRLADRDIRISDDLVVLERSSSVPSNGLAVRKDLNSLLKIKLKQTLLEMHNDMEGRKVLNELGYRKFIETTVDDYTGVHDLAKDADINLETYDYMNY